MSTAEDVALLRLTSARPAELASAIGPRLRPAHSAELVASDAVPSATSAGLRAAGVDLHGPFERDEGSVALDLVAAVVADFRSAPGLGRAEDRLPSADDGPGPGAPRHPSPASPSGRSAAAAPPAAPAPPSAPAAPARLSVVPDPHRPATPAVPVDAALWLEIGALIPEVARRRRQPGRRRRDDRAVLEGILHVLATGIGWRELPQDLGCGSGVTCWRRLREWVDGGTWAVVEPPLRAALGPACGVDWDRPWTGTGRPPGGASPAGPDAGGPEGATARRTTRDPGATPSAAARRISWTGPSLL